jgi:hypothetical protein
MRRLLKSSILAAGSLGLLIPMAAAFPAYASTPTLVATVANLCDTNYDCMHSQGLGNIINVIPANGSQGSPTSISIYDLHTTWDGHEEYQLRPNNSSACMEADASHGDVLFNTCGAGASGSDSWWYSDSTGTWESPEASSYYGGTYYCAEVPTEYTGVALGECAAPVGSEGWGYVTLSDGYYYWNNLSAYGI